VLQILNSSNQRSSTSLPLRRRAAAGVRRELLPSAARQLFGSLHHPRRKCLLAQVEGEAQASSSATPQRWRMPGEAHSLYAMLPPHVAAQVPHDFGDAFGADVTRKAQDRHGGSPKGAKPPWRWTTTYPPKGSQPQSAQKRWHWHFGFVPPGHWIEHAVNPQSARQQFSHPVISDDSGRTNFCSAKFSRRC
jgi:hypothetical protein